MSYDSFGGVLGGHCNFLKHMCFKNFCDYLDLLEPIDEENPCRKVPDKYKEFRYFLNAVESFNNVMDYFYCEYKDQLAFKDITPFRSRVHKEFPALGKIDDLANAYKHCVRRGAGKMRASELQVNQLEISIDLSGEASITDISFSFSGVLPEHHQILLDAWTFWIEYHQKPSPNIFISLKPD